MRIIGKIVLVLVVIALSSVTRTVQVSSFFLSLSFSEDEIARRRRFYECPVSLSHTLSHTVCGRDIYMYF